MVKNVVAVKGCIIFMRFSPHTYLQIIFFWKFLFCFCCFSLPFLKTIKVLMQRILREIIIVIITYRIHIEDKPQLKIRKYTYVNRWPKRMLRPLGICDLSYWICIEIAQISYLRKIKLSVESNFRIPIKSNFILRS